MSRVLICGGPKTGKTTLSEIIGSTLHTDDLINSSAAPNMDAAVEVTAAWLDLPYVCIEGVTVIRALRLWQACNPKQSPPCDKLIWLKTPKRALTSGQEVMTKGINTVFGQIEDWLVDVVEYK